MSKITIIIEVEPGGEGCIARAQVLSGGVEGEVLSTGSAEAPSISAATSVLNEIGLSSIWREIERNDVATCLTCGATWSVTITPTPAGRCPFEYDHEES